MKEGHVDQTITLNHRDTKKEHKHHIKAIPIKS